MYVSNFLRSARHAGSCPILKPNPASNLARTATRGPAGALAAPRALAPLTATRGPADCERTAAALFDSSPPEEARTPGALLSLPKLASNVALTAARNVPSMLYI